MIARPVDTLLKTISADGNSKLHFIDIENIVGAGRLSKTDVIQACARYVTATDSRKNDLFLIAAGPQNREAIVGGWNWGTPFFQFRKGKDGADHALLGFFESISDLSLFQGIYLASGDHSLEPIAERARFLGVPIKVVGGKGSISWVFRSYPQIRL